MHREGLEEKVAELGLVVRPDKIKVAAAAGDRARGPGDYVVRRA